MLPEYRSLESIQGFRADFERDIACRSETAFRDPWCTGEAGARCCTKLEDMPFGQYHPNLLHLFLA